jgi:hypothetical protein
MGDRGNILVLQKARDDAPLGGIFIYSHWRGSELPKLLQSALKRRLRWTDEGYLTRIIVCEVIGKDDFEGETGFGITTYITDNSYPVLIVDVEKQTISVSEHETPLEQVFSVSFEEYCALTEAKLETFRHPSKAARAKYTKLAAKKAG